MNYGAAIMAKGRLAEALDAFERARSLAPYYPIVYVNLGVVEAAMGNQPQAGRDFAQALQLGPQIPDCHTYYAGWLLAQGRPDAAEPLLRTALELSPADLTAQHLLAQIKAAPAPAPSPESYLESSLIQYRAGRYMDAIAAAERSLQLRPGYAEAYNNIGAAWNQLGRYDLGAAACAQALRLKPDFALARNNLDYALEMAGRRQKNLGLNSKFETRNSKTDSQTGDPK
jgi:Flp pilus assembly protein TadD